MSQPIFGLFPKFTFSLPKNKKKIFGLKKKSKKIIIVRGGRQSAQKIAKNWLRRLENTKIENLQYIFDI